MKLLKYQNRHVPKGEKIGNDQLFALHLKKIIFSQWYLFIRIWSDQSLFKVLATSFNTTGLGSNKSLCCPQNCWPANSSLANGQRTMDRVALSFSVDLFWVNSQWKTGDQTLKLLLWSKWPTRKLNGMLLILYRNTTVLLNHLFPWQRKKNPVQLLAITKWKNCYNNTHKH